MLEYLRLGGPVMWILFATGVIMLVVFVERFFHVHRARIKTEDFLKGICNILRRNNHAEAVSICEETPGPVACLVRAAILNHESAPDDIRRAIDRSALTEIARLERRLGVLATTAQVAPLLGLLGTVFGLIHVFFTIQEKAPLVQAGNLADGLWQALLTTAAGLVVAILCYIAYNILVGKVEVVVLDMERAADEILAFFIGSGQMIVEE